MDDNVLAMQQAAEQRVKRMQERNRQLLENGPTFGENLLRRPPEKPALTPKSTEKPLENGLPLLLLLLLLQGGNDRTLLILLAYLML